jgi:hypothetical protein
MQPIRGNPMKRLILALAGYALYRWLTKPEPRRGDVVMAGALPPPRRPPSQRKPAAR